MSLKQGSLIVVGTLLAVAVPAVAMAGGGGGKKTPSRPPIGPLPVPGEDGPAWSLVDVWICRGLAQVGSDVDAVLTYVWPRLYPGVPVDVRDGDDSSVRRVHIALVRRIGAVAADPSLCARPDVTPPTQEPSDVVRPFIHSPPRVRSFYPIKLGDNPAKNARQLFGLHAGDPATPAIVRAIVRSGWNLAKYSRRNPKTADRYTTVYKGKRFDVGSAWLPRHAGDANELREGKNPPRTVTASGAHIKGAPTGGYGAPWIPPLERRGNEVVIAGTDYSPDDLDPFAVAMMPPPEVLAAIGTSIEGVRASWGGG